MTPTQIERAAKAVTSELWHYIWTDTTRDVVSAEIAAILTAELSAQPSPSPSSALVSAVKALERLGRHEGACSSLWPGNPCNCGLTEAIAEGRAAMEQPSAEIQPAATVAAQGEVGAIERLEKLLMLHTGVEVERIRSFAEMILEAVATPKPAAEASDHKPFFYALANGEGKPVFEEICCSEAPGELEEYYEEDIENLTVKIVPVYTGAQIEKMKEDVAALRAEVATAHSENEEQARLLGAGGSREAALMARVEALTKEVAAVDKAAQTDHTKPTALIVRNVIEQRDALRARVAELEAGRDEAVHGYGIAMDQVEEMRKERDQARRELEGARGALESLRKYAWHRGQCAFPKVNAPCDCGFAGIDAALSIIVGVWK